MLKIEENSVSEQTPEQDVWAGEETQDGAFEGATYPELPDNPHNHRFTISLDGRGPMVVVRGGTAQEIKDGFAELEASGFGAYVAAFWAGVQAAKGGVPGPAPQVPAQGFQAPPQGPPFGPNVSVPQAPGYQGPPVQQQAPQQWGGQAPQQQWNNGGGQQAGQQQRKQYPAPQGWYRLNVPFPGGTDQLHAMAAQAGIQKGQPNKGGMYNFWGLTPAGQPGKAWYCAPTVAQAFAQFNPTPA